MLEVRDVHAGYAAARVLHGVSLRVGDAEVVAILGRNGMGKTTLLRAICGLRPPDVATGTIRFLGNDIAGLAPHRVVRAGLCIVPQGRRVFASLTVRENLEIAARPGTNANAWNLARVFDLFPRLGERSGQRAGTMSGGEQQMLAIGRALMTNPRLLVMDEPSEGLSPAMVDHVGERIRTLRSQGQSVLIAEQNVDLALSVADRVDAIGESGTVSWSGDPDSLRADPALVARLVGI